MRKKHAEESARARFHKRVQAGANVDVDALGPTVDTLNALTIFSRRIKFQTVRRRGSMIIATTCDGREIIWPTIADLGSFIKSQAIIADATDVYLPTPDYGSVRKSWDAAAGLILKIASGDKQLLQPPLQEETRDLLRLMWRAAGQPQVHNSTEFIDLMRELMRARRDPLEATPPTVFVAEEFSWVHVPTFRHWVSLPKFTNRLYPLADIRTGLHLLGFEYFENLSRGADGDSEKCCLWRGPLTTLED